MVRKQSTISQRQTLSRVYAAKSHCITNQQGVVLPVPPEYSIVPIGVNLEQPLLLNHFSGAKCSSRWCSGEGHLVYAM